MARGATHPTDDRRVRDRVFRRMPTQGGAPIMAYPGGHPRACHCVGIGGFRMIKSRNDPD